MKLLTLNNTKIQKTNNNQNKYMVAIMHLAPHKLSGYNVCPSASKGCIHACLNTSGFGKYTKVQLARVNKTKRFFEDRVGFQKDLEKDLQSLVNKCEKLGLKPAVRLGGTSDIRNEKIFPSIFTNFSNIVFYDYTKIYNRMLDFLNGKLPQNYHLTFSRSEVNETQCIDVLSKGGNVAVVFHKIPKTYMGYKVYNGDFSDLRFLNKHGVIGLKPKGKAKHDTSSFVI